MASDPRPIFRVAPLGNAKEVSYQSIQILAFAQQPATGNYP